MDWQLNEDSSYIIQTNGPFWQLPEPDHHPLSGPSSSRKNCLWRRTRKLQLFVGYRRLAWKINYLLTMLSKYRIKTRPREATSPCHDSEKGTTVNSMTRGSQDASGGVDWARNWGRIKVPFPFRSLVRPIYPGDYQLELRLPRVLCVGRVLATQASGRRWRGSR